MDGAISGRRTLALVATACLVVVPLETCHAAGVSPARRDASAGVPRVASASPVASSQEHVPRRADGLVPEPPDEESLSEPPVGDAAPWRSLPTGEAGGIACDDVSEGGFPWWDRPTLLPEGFHGGGGLTAECIYTGEVFNNARGGLRTADATRYRGLIDLVLRLDTAGAGLWEGGEFFTYVQSSHGETLTGEFVGDSLFYSSIDTSPRSRTLTQIGEYWYRHSFESGLAVKVGRQDASADFAFADLGGDFVNSGLLTLPNVPLPQWPLQTAALTVFYDAADWVRLSGGLYDSGRDVRQWWVTTASEGLFSIGQVELRPSDLTGSSLPTTLRLAGWHMSNDLLDVEGVGTFDDNFGGYATLDQMLLVERDAEQGLGAFGQFSWTRSDRNPAPVSFGGGLVYRGLLPRRDADVIGLGYTRLDFGPRMTSLAGMTYEEVTELFYKAQLTPWASLQPDLQYLGNPSGVGRDALLAGLRYEVVF